MIARIREWLWGRKIERARDRAKRGAPDHDAEILAARQRQDNLARRLEALRATMPVARDDD